MKASGHLRQNCLNVPQHRFRVLPDLLPGPTISASERRSEAEIGFAACRSSPNAPLLRSDPIWPAVKSSCGMMGCAARAAHDAEWHRFLLGAVPDRRRPKPPAAHWQARPKGVPNPWPREIAAKINRFGDEVERLGQHCPS